MAKYSVPNGKRRVEFAIPAGTAVTVIETSPTPILTDVAGAIRDAIEHPIGCPRLRSRVKPGQKVALIVTDITRKLPEDVILPILVAELLAGGIRLEDMTAVVATGTHRPNSRAELVEMFGESMVDRIRFVNHDAFDPAGLVNLGRTRRGTPVVMNKTVAAADIRIATGVIETHLMAGYSGGVKSVAVGVAGAETIAATHNWEMLRESRLGLVEGNPFRDFLNEATNYVGLDFIVNVVQTGSKELARVVAGEPVQAFLEGVKAARAMYEVAIDAPGDIVIAGVGYPKSRDLYQATRAANTTVFGPTPAVRQGGVILLPASCEDGFGHPGYVEWMSRSDGPDAIIEFARTQGFAPGDQKALILARILKHTRLVITDSLISADDLHRIHLEAAATMQQALTAELERRPDARVLIIPDALLTLPTIRPASDPATRG